MTDEEREAHISAVVDSAPLPPAEDIDRLRALLQMHARPAIEPATARTRPAQPTAA